MLGLKSSRTWKLEKSRENGNPILLKTLLEIKTLISLFTKTVAHTAFWFHSNCTSWWHIFMRSISMLLIPFFKRDQENVTFIILHVLMTNDYTSYVYHSNVLWSLWNYVVLVDIIWIISNKNWGNSSCKYVLKVS